MLILFTALMGCAGDSGVKAFNTDPEAAITSPSGGTAFLEGTSITFLGQASDSEDDTVDMTLQWSSSLSGPLVGTSALSGDVISFTVDAGLEVGQHTIELLALDTAGAAARATVDITVEGNAAPTLSFANPVAGAGYPEGDVVELRLEVADDQDSPEQVALTWTAPGLESQTLPANADSTGVAATYLVDLDPGTYTLSVSGLDSGGASASSQVYFEVTADQDGDGYISTDSGGDDCDDNDPTVYPGAPELCDGLDNNCDGAADETTQTWYVDGDGDGYGSAAQAQQSCEQPTGYADNATDCDDTRPLVNPGANELCDGLDNDCDGAVDNSAADAATWYRDVDNDGFGTSSTTSQSCDQPSGYVADGSDCNDNSAAVNPGATELCDFLDNNCDGVTDEASAADATTWYADNDSDNYGDASNTTAACTQPTAYVVNSSDCNDADSSVNPSATEMCDGVDNNCDGSTDEATAADASSWYTDSDSDGYGDVSSSQAACAQPSGTVSDSTDCDDSDAGVNPGATEVCDGADTDCDGSVDNGATNMSTWYVDSDSDGYGSSSTSQSACDQPNGYVSDNTDCDDSAATTYPGAPEICDSLDNDCDGSADEDQPFWYRDSDGDGYGDATVTQNSCTAPNGYVSTDDDCDDTDANISPGAAEICDGVDNDCDGTTDGSDAVDAVAWAVDGDGDGYGDASSSVTACSPPTGTVADDTDCDDSDATINPGAQEICDGLDNDCDGSTEVGLDVPSTYSTIGAAITAASSGDLICVAAGTYYESIDYDGKNIVIQGTAGATTTILDGAGGGPVVSFTGGETTDAQLIGFTVQNGAANNGAGVYVSSASPTLQDVVIRDNDCTVFNTCRGTGMYASYFDGVLDNVQFVSNNAAPTSSSGGASVLGGALYLNYSDPTIVDSDFIDNVASLAATSGGSSSGTVRGGVIYMYQSSPAFTGAIFDGNMARANTSTSSGNYTINGGVIWASQHSDATFQNTWMTENSSTGYYVYGGVVWADYYSDTDFTNSIIAGNVIGSSTTYRVYGGIFYLYSFRAEPLLLQVDIVGNTVRASERIYGAVFNVYVTSTSGRSSGVDLHNTNVVDNISTSSNIYGGIYYANSSSYGGYTSIAYSNFHGNTSTNDWYNRNTPVGTNGNLAVNPLYTDTSFSTVLNWDLTLQNGSPVSNAGDRSIRDVDGSYSAMGSWGGPGAANW